MTSANLIFGKYEIIKRLAIGGMGEIFLSRQVSGIAGFERLVILKSLLPDLAADTSFVEQFLDEARVGATLNHPNIVSIYEAGMWDRVYFMAMEYIRGENLAELLNLCRKNAIKFPVPVAASVIRDAALALDHAHHARSVHGQTLGIVHRDISPHNIMVRDDGVTKVVDFGIAKAANRASRTQTGTLKGKLAYMAPEQVNLEIVDGRTDQFALGLVFWELLVGRRLFQAENDARLLGQVLEAEITKPSDHVPGLAGELDAIVMRMLDRDPSKRFPRASDVAHALQDYLTTISRQVELPDVAALVKDVAGTRIQAKHEDLTPSRENFLLPLNPHPEGTATQEQGRTRRRAAPKKWRVSAAVLVLLAAGTLFLLTRHSPSPVREQTASLEPVPTPAPTPASEPAAAEPNQSVSLEIKKPKGAKVFINGVAWAHPVPTTVTGLEPGSHQVRLELPGRPPIKRVVQVEAASSQPVVVANDVPTELELTSDPEKATVRAGEAILGMTPLTIRTLAPGTVHVLSVEKRGYDAETVEVRLDDGEKKTMAVALKKAAPRVASARPPPSPAPVSEEDGFVSINTSPWTQVVIDGAPYGSTPIFKLRLRPGAHKISLTNTQAGIQQQQTTVVQAGKTTKIDLKLK